MEVVCLGRIKGINIEDLKLCQLTEVFFSKDISLFLVLLVHTWSELGTRRRRVTNKSVDYKI